MPAVCRRSTRTICIAVHKGCDSAASEMREVSAPANISLRRHQVGRSAGGRVAKDSFRFWIFWRTKLEERINRAPIAGHCAPCPVKIPRTRGSGGLPPERLPMAEPAFCLRAASLLSIFRSAVGWSTQRRPLWLGVGSCVSAKSKPSRGHRCYQDEFGELGLIAPRRQPRMSQ